MDFDRRNFFQRIVGTSGAALLSRALGRAKIHSNENAAVPNADANGPAPAKSFKRRVILFGADGIPPQQLLFFSKRGVIPNITRLLKAGSLTFAQPSTPTDCPTNWTTINTGTWSGTTGINGFYRHEPGEAFGITQHETWGATGMENKDHLWELLSRYGKKSILVDWPTVDFAHRKDAVIVGDGGGGRWPILGPSTYSITRDKLPPAKGWENLPKSSLPPLEWRVPRTDSIYYFPSAEGLTPFHWRDYVHYQIKERNKYALALTVEDDLLISENDPEKNYFFLIYASGQDGYDRVLLTKRRDAANPMAVMKPGEAPVAVYDRFLLENGKHCDGGFYVQILHLHDAIEIFRTDIESNTGWGVPAGVDEDVAKAVGPYLSQESVMVQDPTFSRRGYSFRLAWDGLNASWLARTALHLAERYPDWDLLAVYYDSIDQVNHALMGDFLMHTYPAWQSDKHEFALKTMERAFGILDNLVGVVVDKLADENTTVVLVSDHGHIPALRRVALAELLWKAGLISYNWEPPRPNRPGRFVVDWPKTKCVPFYFADNIFINLKGRDPHGVVSPEDYRKVQDEIIRTLENLVDPETGKPVIELAIRKQDAFPLGHFADDPYVGDVLYFMEPGYIGPSVDSTQLIWHDWKKAEPPTVDPASYYVWTMSGGGWHDDLPGLIYRDDEGNEVSIFSTLLMSGRGIKHDFQLPHPTRLVDVAPTIAFLLGLPPPRDAEGAILTEILELGELPGTASVARPK